MVFQSHPSALGLHRALMTALAAGNAEEAADTASALAKTVKRVLARHKEKRTSDGGDADTEEEAAQLPPISQEDVAGVVDATQRAVLRGHTSDCGPSVAAVPSEAREGDRSFWLSPESLCVTLLESAFETELPEDGAAESADLTEAGNRALVHEERQLSYLDECLGREQERWKAQKNAIAKTVLDVARSLGLTPIDLHAAERESHPGTQGKLNALHHVNVVVRGEVPSFGDAASADSALSQKLEEEVTVLKERMASRYGKVLTREEEAMARYELMLANTTMRYVVGLHREVQLALEQSTAVTRAREAAAKEPGGDVSATNVAFFLQKVMEALHRQPSPGREAGQTGGTSEVAEGLLTKPVLPFTFMLKCCLWFAVPEEVSSPSVAG